MLSFIQVSTSGNCSIATTLLSQLTSSGASLTSPPFSSTYRAAWITSVGKHAAGSIEDSTMSG